MGNFYHAMTIPIAIVMGIYMKSIRPEKVLENFYHRNCFILITVIYGRNILGTGAEPLFNIKSA
jgi:carbon starvation protein CstA